MIRARAAIAATCVAVVLNACGGSGSSSDVRGKGLTVAALPASAQARIYAAAAAGSFDVENTSLLLDRRSLPRAVGLADGGPISSDVVAELKRRGTIKGICE